MSALGEINMKNYFTYKKLILLFLAVITPVFLLSMILFWQANAAIQRRIIFNVQEKTNLTAQFLDDTLDQIYSTALGLADQQNLKHLTNPNYPMTAYETAANILQIRDQQISIMNANQYIENITVYYRERGQAYNSTNASFNEFTDEEYQQLTDFHRGTAPLILYNEGLSLTVLPGVEPNYLLRVDLSAQALISQLENTLVEYEDYYLLDAFDHSYQLTNLSEEQLLQIPVNAFSAEFSMDKTKYYRFSSSLSYGNIQLHFFLSEAQLFSDVKIYQYGNLCFILFVLIICCVFLWGSYTIIHKPMLKLIDSFQDINRQNYDVRILSQDSSDFSYLYKEFNHMAEQLGILIEKDYQQKLLLNKAELKQLQAQINPHFLYNSLFLLRNMIYDSLYDEALTLADTLGQYFQYITRSSQDYMPLGKEYKHALLYCEIQKLRFEGRIRVETDPLPDSCADILVPKLIIQPLLENSFNYGLREKVSDGLLRVSVSTQISDLVISVEDNGDILSDQKLEDIKNNLQICNAKNSLQETTGILNIQRRLNIYFDDRGYLKVSRSPLGGLCVQLILPIPEPEI